MDPRQTESLTAEDLRLLAEIGIDIHSPLFLYGPSWDHPEEPFEIRFSRMEEGLRGCDPAFRNMLLVPLAEEWGVPYTPEPEGAEPPSPATPAEPPGHP